MDETTSLLSVSNRTMYSHERLDATPPSETTNQEVDNDVVLVVRRFDRKWLLLFLYCCLAFLQSSVFVAWNPIGNSVVKAFGPEWSASTLAWQINLATIANPFIQWPVWKAIHRYDLSRALRWGAAFPLLLATSLMCVPTVTPISNEVYKWLSFVAFFFIGLVGVVFYSSITRFSSLWFPQNQRTTATGLSCTCANLGALLPSLVGPQIVSDPNSSDTDPLVLRTQIQNYLLIYFSLSSVLFLIFFAYFPSESSRRSSVATENPSVSSSLKLLVRKPYVLATILVYSLNCLAHVWGSTLLTLTLAPLRISQTSIGLMTTSSLLATALLTVGISRLADLYFQQNLKNLLMLLLPTHTLSMIVFCATILTADRSINNEVLISVLYVVAMASLNTCTPLLFELGCEMSHPVSEEIVGGTFDQTVNAFSIAFHSMFTYVASNSGDYSSILYLLMVLPSITLVIFSFVKEEYIRTNQENNTQ